MFRNRPFGLVSGVFVSCLLASLKESTLGLQLLSLNASSLFVCLSSRRVWRVPVLSISAFSRPYRDWQFSCWVFPSSQTQFSKGSTSLVYHDVVLLLKQSWFWIWMYLRNLCECVQKPDWEKEFCQAERRWHFTSCKIDSSCIKFCNFKDQRAVFRRTVHDPESNLLNQNLGFLIVCKISFWALVYFIRLYFNSFVAGSSFPSTWSGVWSSYYNVEALCNWWDMFRIIMFTIIFVFY